MRILQIIPFMKSEALSPKAGGMPRASLRLVRILLERGHAVAVLPIPEGVGSELLWEISPGKTLNVLPTMNYPGRGDWRWLPAALLRLRPRSKSIREAIYDTLSLSALNAAVRSFHPEIIHNQLARNAFPRLATALRLQGKLVLTHRHGEMGEGLQAYDRIVFPSQSGMRAILEESGFPAEQSRCVHNAVSPIFSTLPIAGDARRKGIWYVGAVRRRKGIDLILDAYRLDERLRQTPLFVCGAGEDTALLKDAVLEGLPVHPLGLLEPEELASRLMTAEAVVIPSRLEGFSTALLEALCCGAPVIGWAPQVREMEFLLGRRVGIPFDGRTQTAQDLADQIRVLFDELSGGKYERNVLAECVRRRFSVDNYLQGYLEVYRELAGDLC